MKPNKQLLAKLSEQLVTIDGGKPLTTSLTIAQKFTRKHKNVLQAIENTVANGSVNRLKNQPINEGQRQEIEAFSREHFIPSHYKDEMGREQRMYLLTEAGCMKIILSFTGADADVWQIRFINAFERMKARLRHIQSQQLTFDWQEARQDGKIMRRELTDTAKEFVAYAKAQGSRNAVRYYKHLTDAVYHALYEPPKSEGVPMRECLSAHQLRTLALAEEVVQKAIIECMDRSLDYHDVFKVAKAKAEALGQVVGKQEPGARPLLRALAG